MYLNIIYYIWINWWRSNIFGAGNTGIPSANSTMKNSYVIFLQATKIANEAGALSIRITMTNVNGLVIMITSNLLLDLILLLILIVILILIHILLTWLILVLRILFWDINENIRFDLWLRGYVCTALANVNIALFTH